MKLVIICGGVGSKMWPLSRQSNPKQFAKLIDGKSLFQKNYEVLRKRHEVEDIYVQTIKEQAELAKEQVSEIPEENYFIQLRISSLILWSR